MNAVAPSQTVQNGGRKYRSKKQRPCDLCRSRKTQCNIQDGDTVCDPCKKVDRECTFVAGPLVKKRKAVDGDEAGGPVREGHGLGPSYHDDIMNEYAAGFGGDASTANQLFLSAGEPFWYGDFSQRLEPGLQQIRPGSSSLSPRDIGNAMTTIGQSAGDSSTLHAHQNSIQNLSSQNRSVEIPGTALGASPVFANFAGMRMGTSGSSQGSPPTGDRGAMLSGPSLNFGSPGSGFAPNIDLESPGSHRSDWPATMSLDSRQGFSSHLIGLSSESDPFLLRHYIYNQNAVYPMFRLHFRKVVDDISLRPAGTGDTSIPANEVPVHFNMTDEEIMKDGLQAAESLFATESTSEKKDLDRLIDLVPRDLGKKLVKLYSRYVHPRFPVLTMSNLADMPFSSLSLLLPVGLQSAVYALAAPFTFLDDELAVSKGYLQVPTEELWAIANRSFQRTSCYSHLSSLQLCLLILQRPAQHFTVADPPAFWALSCSAVALAEGLGVNLDPLEWQIPHHEIILRRRLWWLTYSQHTWHAIVLSRPSHINDSNWSVSSLTTADLELADGDDTDPAMIAQVPLCLADCELSYIAADILHEFYTIKAIRSSPSLSTLLTRAQPLRARIESWRQSLPLLSKPASELDEDEFDYSVSLRLSHLTLEILIFRALLRPLASSHNTGSDNREPISTILENCCRCATVGVEIVSALKSKHFVNYWPPYVRYQLCYISSFLLMSLAQSPTMEWAVRNRKLLIRWRDTIRMQARAWPLARLAAIRLDAVFWKGLSLVVSGSGQDSPAVLLLKDEKSAKERSPGG